MHVLENGSNEVRDRENLRDNHGRYREVVGTGGIETLFYLLRGRGAMVLNVSIFEVAVERFKIKELGDIRMSRGAMITFVEVIRENLPVVFPVKLVGVIQLIVVEVVRFVSFLFVNVCEVLLPWDLGRCFAIHIHPDEAVDVDLDMNFEQTILILIKTVQVLIARCFGELSIQSIRPAVVSTSQNFGISMAFILNDRICTVSAYIVEGVDVVLSVTRDDEVEPSHLIAKPVTGLFQARAMGNEEPSFGENGTPFQLIHLR